MQTAEDKTQPRVTSFHKKSAGSPRIPGTRVSYHNAQLLTSTGVPFLDFHLGGGLPVGTVLLIEEDAYNTYSSFLLKYFLVEGITNNHTIFVAGSDVEPKTILEELPAIATSESRVLPPVPDDQLKIAWRYKNQKSTPEMFPSFGHLYDLSRQIRPELLEKANVVSWNLLDHCSETNNNEFVPAPYLSLLSQIRTTINDRKFQTSERNCNSLLRIAVCSLGSPLWNVQDDTAHQTEAIPRFLYALRSLLRRSYSIALVTVKTILANDRKLMSKIYQMSDFVVKLESFVGTEKGENAMLKDFDGLLYIIKLPCLNTFVYQIPTSDLAFKLKRKHFQISHLHLPPDVDEATSDNVPFSCGSQSKLLDF